MLTFNFENAFLHYNRTGGPPGFGWKLMLSYIGVSIVFIILFSALFGGLFFSLMGASTDPEQTEALITENLGAILGIYALMLPLGFFFYAIFDACGLRRYMRVDGFKLRVGGDELRLIVVYIIWLLFFVGAYVLVLVGAAALAVIDTTLGVIAGIVLGFIWLYLTIRFSAAGALTVRDQRIRFLASWRVTQGKFWVLLGSYLLWFVVLMVAYFILVFLAMIIFAGVFAAGANGFSDPEALAAASPVVLVIGGVAYLALLGAAAYFYYIWAGPAALAARTDPDYAGYMDPSAEFA